jgi:multidrug transporter EmrE-like cation transporter
MISMDKFYIFIYLILTVSGLTLVKLGSKGNPLLSRADDKLVWNVGPLVLLGLAFYVLSFLLFMWLISQYQLSVLIPLTTALVQLLIFIIAVTLFNEQFTFLKLVALVLIVAGVVLLQVKSGTKLG